MKTLNCFLLLILLPAAALAADVQVYFSPNGGAQDAIVAEINRAQQEVLVQAYSFTSAPIANALVQAHKRGVQIQVILDKGNQTDRYSSLTFFRNEGIPTYIDDQVAMAHNKIMIIDRQEVITGSFNFTKSAEVRNAENLLILKNDPQLTTRYYQNFLVRLQASRLIN